MENKKSSSTQQDGQAGRITDVCFYALVAFGILAFSVIVASVILY